MTQPESDKFETDTKQSATNVLNGGFQKGFK